MDLIPPQLLSHAAEIYRQHFPATTSFERAIFFSWGCTIGDCQFCYMSTQPADKKPSETKRSVESILAEFILAKKLGWDIGFFTGGIGVFSPAELEFMLKAIQEITGEKIWLSVGPLSKPLLQRYLPYIKGVVGSTETINPELHAIVCPSKPLAPYERMFDAARELQLRRAMTFIVGMGETHADLELLKEFIRRYAIDKIHIYGLIPQQGTKFEHAAIPSPEDQAWWIAQLRIAFPRLDIQCGVWEDRVERISLLLNAGANSISKFRATALFATPAAHEIERQAALGGREFKGTLTTLPVVDWNAEVQKLPFEEDLKVRIQYKLEQYLRKMRENIMIEIPVTKKI
ncbi:radical SAM protein [Candidatus Woesearchaeota archaeon]|nr:radical SAM protein [Candidatus Woesearchaeota archaeon]